MRDEMFPKLKRKAESPAPIRLRPKIKVTPPELSLVMFSKVCDIIGTSQTGTFKACEILDVNRNAFYGLLDSSEKAREIYARSKDAQVELLAEQMLDIADAPVAMTEHGYDSADVQNKRVRIDTRKWLASKLMPKKYGDHLDLTSGGEKLAQPPASLSYKIVEGRTLVGRLDAPAQDSQ